MQDLGHKSEMIALLERVIVLPEANPGLPLRGDFERMARRRFQDPKPFRESNWWWIKPRRDEFVDGKLVRRQKRLKVAPATVGDREARRIADELVRPMNQGLETIGAAMQFGAYVKGTYESAVLPLLADSTRKNYRYALGKYLLPVFYEMLLRDMSRMALQKYFSALQVNYTIASKIKDVLANVLNSAVRFGLIVMNPLDGVQLRLPRVGKRPKSYITPEQFDKLVNLMAEPYATMLCVCVLAGLRVSELVALKWEDIGPDSLTIDERYRRGDRGCPKTHGSSATIGVDASVIKRIHSCAMSK